MFERAQVATRGDLAAFSTIVGCPSFTLYISLVLKGVFFSSTYAFIIALFGNGFASITWVFVSLLAPKRLIGIAGGTFNFIGGTASIIIPIVIGFLAKGGDFAPALTLIACITFAGALPTFSWLV
ncbi:hypothetical protein [Peribacillus phoenicis]|uniref:hypothetical protein n=1 Tax=unclassified Peribacillus TaxID=2675266 RepID=UPI0039A2A376